VSDRRAVQKIRDEGHESWVGILYGAHTKVKKFGSDSLARVEDLGAPSSTSSYTPPPDPQHAVCCVERCNLTKSDCGGIQFYPLNEQDIHCISGLISNPGGGIEKSDQAQAQIPRIRSKSCGVALDVQCQTCIYRYSAYGNCLLTHCYHGRTIYSKAVAGLVDPQVDPFGGARWGTQL